MELNDFKRVEARFYGNAGISKWAAPRQTDDKGTGRKNRTAKPHEAAGGRGRTKLTGFESRV